MKTILLDCDGVICDFVGGINEFFRKNDITTFDPLLVKNYDMCSIFTPEQKRGFEMARTSLNAAELAWYPGAKEFLEGLKTIGRIVVVTAAWDPETWCADRNEWLSDFVNKNDILYVPTKNKNLIRGDALIEDNAQTLIEWPGDVKILVNRPWNEYSCACDRYRYHTYSGIIDQLERTL